MGIGLYVIITSLVILKLIRLLSNWSRHDKKKCLTNRTNYENLFCEENGFKSKKLPITYRFLFNNRLINLNDKIFLTAQGWTKNNY